MEDSHLPQRLAGVLVVALVFGAAMHFAFPQFTDSTVKAAGELDHRIAGADCRHGTAAAEGRGGRGEAARFTALDGTVKIKKSSQQLLDDSGYNVPLEKGDVVQTGSEGMAKIVFNDGTNYTVKQDSLIVIEENSANDQQQTNVAVAVSTGTVDLSTATYVQGSKSQVIVAGATRLAGARKRGHGA